MDEQGVQDWRFGGQEVGTGEGGQERRASARESAWEVRMFMLSE